MQGVILPRFREFSMEKLLGWLVSALAFLFPITVLTVNRADSVILLLLGIIGAYAFLRRGIRELAFNRQELLLMGAFLSWYVVIVCCYFAGDKTDIGFKMIGRNLRLLFIIPAFIACRSYGLKARPLLIGLVLAPFGALAFGLWQFLHGHGDIRASGVAEIIPFGDFSMAMGFMALAGLYADKGHRNLWRYLLATAALMAGVSTSILSATRGGWIALPIFVALTIVVFSENSIKRGIKVLIFCSFIVVLTFVVAPRSIIRDRVSTTVDNLVSYSNFIRLIKANDAQHMGCLNDKLFLGMLAQKIKDQNVSGLMVSVTDDGMELDSTGPSVNCRSNTVIKATNVSNAASIQFSIPRSLIHPEGLQTVQFLARGNGMIAMIYGNTQNWENINTTQYRTVDYAANMMELAWPVLQLPPGETLYFAPIQTHIGEYIYPFANDSIGERLEMWRAAWHVFLKHPWVGAGTGSFKEEVDKMVRVGEVSPQVISYDHPHNDYLNALSGGGFLGLIAYLVALIYPLVLYAKALRENDRCVRSMGYLGIIMIAGLLIFGITESMFIHSIVMSWYVTFTAMLMAVILNRKDTEQSNAGI